MWESNSCLLHVVELFIYFWRNPWNPSFAVLWLHHCFLCWGTSSYMANGSELPVLSAWLSAWQGMWQAFYLRWRKTCHLFAPGLLEWGLCSPAGCQPPSPPHEAHGSGEHMRTLKHSWHFMKCMRKRPAHHSSVHIAFSVDCYRYRSNIFFTLNFILLSSFHWKSALQEKLQDSHVFGIGIINWNRLWILWRVPGEILDWHTAKRGRDC